MRGSTAAAIRAASRGRIPIHGRIAAVADVYDALTRDRPYRQAMSPGEAASLMAEGRGTHFDQDVLDIFMHTVPVPA